MMTLRQAGWLCVAVAMLSVWLTGCAGHVTPTDGPTGREAARLHRLLEDYYQARLVLFPLEATVNGDHRYDDRLTNDISDAHRAQVAALAEKCARDLEHIDRARLSEADQLSWDVFQSDLTRIRAGLKFPKHWLPVGEMQDLPTAFVLLGSGKDVQPFQTVRDYERFLGRVDGFLAWVETALANMRLGMAAGVVQPRVIIAKSLTQLEGLLAMDEKQNPFYQPVREMPAGFSAADRDRLTRTYRETIQQRIMPTYRRLAEFLRSEYLPHCRETIGWSALPQGREWYAQWVRHFTTTELTPEQLYATGLAEVERLRQEMEKLKAEAGFTGDLAAFSRHLDQTSPGLFKSKETLVQAYRDLRATVEPRLPALFGRLPKGVYEIRAVEAFREATSSSQLVSAAPDGSRPAVFYVNAAGIEQTPQFISESLFLHEAMPGHHLQSAIAMERTDLPSFRRFGWYDAYGEGWALYSEGLGSELGCYRDARQRLDFLGSEMFRARRLVVDVGLHLKGWSRDQAYQYLLETPGFTAADAALEVDRYIAWPGQALSYKTGQLRIRALRAKAEQALGERFDVRGFHDEVLKDGGLPLDVLDAKLDRWIAAQGGTALKPECRAEAPTTNDRAGIVFDLVWGRYDVSKLVPTAAQRDEHRTKPFPLRFALLSADVIHTEKMNLTLRGRLGVEEIFTGATISNDEAIDAAVCGLHIFRSVPVLNEAELTRYVCQMVGVSIHDRPCVLLNFLGSHGERWETRFECWSDGGPSFVQMLYDVRERRIVKLKMNGYF